MGFYCNYNGSAVEERAASISPNNRSFRYGDGCFETMKVIGGEVLLWDLHMNRFFSSLQTLQFSVPPYLTVEFLKNNISELVKKNGHEGRGRVRLVAFRGDGGLYENADRTVNFIIQTWAGKEESNQWKETGLHVTISTDARVTADLFSPVKSNNYLRQAMAAMFAQDHGFDDCILTNAFNRIADSTIANVFIVDRGVIKTPPLSEGPVGGVMRQHLSTCFVHNSLPFAEQEITVVDLLGASEVFLTNAITGIRWVKQIGDRHYDNSTTRILYKKFVAPLFEPATI
jgi:aminodeoxychorismate lyase